MRYVFVIFLFVFFACSQEKTPDLSSKVFRYNQPNQITSLDPAFCKTQNNIWAVNHIFNGLVQLDDSLSIQPCIAKSWEISEQGKVYVFHLRNDVFFHDDECFPNGKGRRLVASDVVHSFSRLTDPTINSPGSWLFSGHVIGQEGFAAIDDTTFQLRLTEGFIPILGMLTMQYCAIIPHEAIEKYGKNFRAHPVGTGPYRFKRWEEDQALFLQKNDHYFESNELPKLDYIKTTFIPDKQIAVLELLAGKIDFTAGIESSFINELLTHKGELRADKKSKINYIKTPYLNHEYLGINMSLAKGTALEHKKVRQALNYAIDRKAMLSTLRNNVGDPASGGFVPKGLPSFNDSIVRGYTYDLDKAKMLLVEAGYPQGKGLTEITLQTNNEYLDLCTFVAKQWESIGIKTSIEVKETAVLREGMRNSTIGMFRASWIADYPDAESFLTMFYSKNPAPPNYTRFKNASFDALYEKAIKEDDIDRRYTMYHDMDKILVEEAPVIFLFYDQSSVFLNNKVKGYSNNGINLLNVKRLHKKNHEES